MIEKTLANDLRALCDRGEFADAARNLFAQADAGHLEALVTASQWRVFGTIVPRDLPDARRLLAKASEAGSIDGVRWHAFFLAAGVGGPANWTAAVAELRKIAPLDHRIERQLTLITRASIDAVGRSTRTLDVRRLSVAPEVWACDDFAATDECDYLATLASASFQPSLVVDPVTGGMIPNPVRRSDGMMFSVFDEDLVVNALNRRMAALSGTDFRQGEALQVLRYSPGGEYRAHLDAVPHTDNQRIATVLVYLSDDYDGGETQFVATGLRYKGRKGAALLFRNVLPNGELDPAALHAGLPVTRGTKLLASRWIRARPLQFPSPAPIVSESQLR